MKRIFLFAILLLAVISAPTRLIAAEPFPLPDQPHIIANGLGAIEKTPDIVTLRFNVSAKAESLSAAKKTVDNIVAKAIAAATKNAVIKDHITASKLSAYPQYEWKNSTRRYVGEQVDRLVEIKLTKTKRYNGLVDGLLSAGVTRLQPAQLDFSQREKLESDALLVALDNARNKARAMANHLGAELGEIYQIAPVDQHQRVQSLSMRANSESNMPSAPLSLGKQKIEQRVQVVFLLKK